MTGWTLLQGLIGAGLLIGTPLLLAAIGEIFAERSGVLNLGIEGMMLFSAMSGFWAACGTGSCWVGLIAAIIAGTLLSAIHAVGVITCKADQVVSGLALGFFGAGLASIFGVGLVGQAGPSLPELSIPVLETIPILGPTLFKWNVIVPIGLILSGLGWILLERTRFGLYTRAVGEAPQAASVLGVSVTRQRYLCTLLGGATAGMAGGALSLAVTPGWVDNITAGQGWIAIGLVVFSRFKPWRAVLGAFIFGALRRAIVDLQGIPSLPFFKNPNLGYFLTMLPYLITVFVLLAEGMARKNSEKENLNAE